MSRKEESREVRTSTMEEDLKKILKFLDSTNATNLVTSKQIVLQMKNGLRKAIRKGMMKEGPRSVHCMG